MRRQGTVTHIFIATNAGDPMREAQEVRAIEGLGIEGDRYASERGSWSKSKHKKTRHISLIEQEAIDRANDSLRVRFLPQDTRRNIVVKNFSLNRLIGKEFMISGVQMRGIELCDPCGYPSKLSGKPDFRKAFQNFGGLRAEILNSGTIRVGDYAEALTYTCLLCDTTTLYPHICPVFYPRDRG